jgi:hypothetical protein
MSGFLGGRTLGMGLVVRGLNQGAQVSTGAKLAAIPSDLSMVGICQDRDQRENAVFVWFR